MQLSIEVIDVLRKAAQYISGVLSEATITPNHFYNALWDGRAYKLAPYQIVGDELVVQTGDGVVAFSGVYPSKILAMDVDAPIKTRESNDSVELNSWMNSGSTPIEYTEKYTVEHTITDTLNIASEIASSIKASVGAEYMGIKASVEAQLSAKLGITHDKQDQQKSVSEKSISVEVPAWTSTSLVQKQSTSDFRQTIRLRCELDAAIRLEGGWTKRFGSIQEMQTYMRGGGGGSGDASLLDTFVNTRKFEKFDMPLPEMLIEQIREYKDVKTGEVDRTDTPINHE